MGVSLPAAAAGLKGVGAVVGSSAQASEDGNTDALTLLSTAVRLCYTHDQQFLRWIHNVQ